MASKGIKIDRPTTIIPAFTVIRVPGGWSFVKMTVDEEHNVLTWEQSVPDMKSIITERFRIEVGKYWSKIDGQNI